MLTAPAAILRFSVKIALALAPLALAAQSNITVNAGQYVRGVNDRMFGINAVMWDGLMTSSQTISLVQAADIRMVRMPGGSLSDEYHWNVNRSGTNTWTWAAGTDAFTTFITSLDANATVSVNYGTGTPEEAAAWVAYLNAPSNLQGTSADVTLGVDALGRNWQTAGYWSALRGTAKLASDDGMNFLRVGRSAPYGFKNWEIGNECYGTWETDQQAVPHDPYTYATRAKDYIAKMKAVDPTIKIGAVAVTGENSDVNNTNHPATNPRTGAVHNGWTPVMLSTFKALGVTPDALIYHRYEQNPNQESDAGLLQVTKTWPNDAADLRQQLTDYLGTAGTTVELVVTENNSVNTNPGKQATSLVNGLFYADTIGNILQTEFDEYVWWALRNGAPTSNGTIIGNLSSSLYGWRQYGDYGIISSAQTGANSSNYEPYPDYYTMKLVSHFARGGDAIVKATCDNPLLSAFAARRADGTLTLLVVNNSPTADTSANITLNGFTPAATATVYSYGVPQDNAAQTGSGSTDIATSSIANAAATFALTFPHYSATVVSFAQAGPQILVAPASISTGTGANVAFSVVANGSGLTYQWQKDGAPIAGATQAAVSLSNVTTANSGNYTVSIRDAAGAAVTSNPAGLSVAATAYVAPGSQLVNISTRALVSGGNSAMIAGFTVGGQGSKKVLIRAAGPALASIGLSGALLDPQLEVTRLDGTSIAYNDDWGSGDANLIAQTGASVGAFPFNSGSKDAALILTLPPGSYTALVRGGYGSSGVALVEVYDCDQQSAARLINISTRAQVGSTPDTELVGGFSVHGAQKRSLLIRGVGPTLAPIISGMLLDPQLDLATQSGTAIASNGGWANDPNIAAAGSASGAFPLATGGVDAALLASLSDGGYTANLRGKSGTPGIGLVEIYEVPQ